MTEGQVALHAMDKVAAIAAGGAHIHHKLAPENLQDQGSRRPNCNRNAVVCGIHSLLRRVTECCRLLPI